MIIDTYDIKTGQLAKYPRATEGEDVEGREGGFRYNQVNISVEDVRFGDYTVAFTGLSIGDGYGSRVLYKGPDAKQADRMFEQIVCALQTDYIREISRREGM